jgi:hypothetical protein
MARKLTIGLIAAALLAIVGVSWVANTAAEQPPSECVRLAISHSDDPAAGVRHAQGEEIEMEWLSDIVICPGAPGSVGGPKFGGTLFIELKPLKGG